MRKLLFVHGEEKVKEDEMSNLYTGGSYSSDVWKRYKMISDSLTVVFRKEDKIYSLEEAKKKFHLLDKDIHVKFVRNRKKNIISFISPSNILYNYNLIKENVEANDIIFARVPSDVSYYAIKMAKKYNKKLIVEVVGCPFDSSWYHSFAGKILSIPSYFRMKKYVKLSPNVIYVTNKFLQRRYPTFGNSIGCSDVSLCGLDHNVLKLRNKVLNSKSKTIILGTCGAIDVKYKGQRYVIKALSKLVSLGYNVKYELVGGGDNTFLQKVAKKYGVLDRVIFKGPLSHDKVFDWLKKIDIYIQPSNTEGLSRALIEAMSCACFCIASNVGGNPELIDNNCIFKNGDVSELTEILKKVIVGDINYYDEAVNNYNKAKDYVKDVLSNRRNNFFDDVINKR